MFRPGDVLEIINGLNHSHSFAVGADIGVKVSYQDNQAVMDLTGSDGESARFFVAVSQNSFVVKRER